MDPLRNIPRLAELSSHLLRLPATDRGAFSTLTTIPDIQAWATSKADEYRQFTLALLAIHNLAAPIHRLPTEVLKRILEQCWQDGNSLRLPHICSLWRSILLNTPEFWADAVAQCELEEKREIVRSELPFIQSLLSRSTLHDHAIEPNFYVFAPAITQLVTPYSNSIASMHVTIGKMDLQDGLWPALLSGMQNLETLTIVLAITEEDVSQYRRITTNTDHFLGHYHSTAWPELPILSRDALPKLSRLTCPHGMVGRFANVPLRHLKAQIHVVDRSQLLIECYSPTVVLGRPQGLHLEPHRSRLETLEIMPTDIVQEKPYTTTPLQLLGLFSLRHLRIEGNDDVVSRTLSWLRLPQDAFVHITWPFYTSGEDLGKIFHPIVNTIDRVCFQQLNPSSYMNSTPNYRMRSYSGGIERLRIDDLHSADRTLLLIFGEYAPVTHLELSAVDPYLVMRKFDLHAFPHLTHLNVSGSFVRSIGWLLQPTVNRGRPSGWGSADLDDPALPSLKLAELVISCPITDSRYLDCKDTDFGTKVDEFFRKEFDVFQKALTDRAARGTRLTSLALSLRPATPEGTRKTERSKAHAQKLEAAGAEDQEQARPKDKAGCDGGPDNNPGSSSNEKAKDTGPELKPCAVWPSHTVRQAFLESLRELVDGPVTLKLLDDAGDEVSLEDA